jgi:hypothetical protein
MCNSCYKHCEMPLFLTLKCSKFPIRFFHLFASNSSKRGPLLHSKGGLKFEGLIPPTLKDLFNELNDGHMHQRFSKISCTLCLTIIGGQITFMAYCCSLWRWLIKKFMNFDIIQNFFHFFEIIFYTHCDYYLIWLHFNYIWSF